MSDDGAGPIIIIRRMQENLNLSPKDRARLKDIADMSRNGIGYFDRRFVQRCLGKLLARLRP